MQGALFKGPRSYVRESPDPETLHSLAEASSVMGHKFRLELLLVNYSHLSDYTCTCKYMYTYMYMYKSQVENEHYSVCVSTEHLLLYNSSEDGVKFCHVVAVRPIATMRQVLTPFPLQSQRSGC